jgi:hypothetical protein
MRRPDLRSLDLILKGFMDFTPVGSGAVPVSDELGQEYE